MKQKVILSLAMSLDGFIATKSDGFDWIVGDGDKTLNTKNFWDYKKFLETVDTVVMGSRCFEQGFHQDFLSKKVFVSSSKKLKDHENIHFVSGDIVKKIVFDTKVKTKNIFVFGGGGLVHNFLKSDAIDEYYIGIVPVILGDGIPLFSGTTPTIKLHLLKILSENGIVVLKYEKHSA